MLKYMAARLGFCNDDALRAARSDVLKAIWSSGLLDYQAAWTVFHRLADTQIDALPDVGDTRARALIGINLVKADIWREASDRVRYFHELGLVEDAANELAEEGEDAELDEVRKITGTALGRAAKSHSFIAEFMQATGRFEYAINAYVEREQDECLTLREHGMVNLRLAECYRGLLHTGTDDFDFVQDTLETSIESALEYLKAEPEHFWALRMRDELEQP